MAEPITRRSALRTGGLAAIMAGLLGTVGTAATGQASTPAPAGLATVVNADDLAAMCRRIKAEYLEKWERALAIGDELERTLTPEQRELFNEFSDRMNDADTIQQDFWIAEIARHMPGLAPVLLMLSEHVFSVSYGKPGACCTALGGFEP